MEAAILGIALSYLVLGVLFALFFALVGAALLDPVARESSVGFRLLTIPAAIALWPLLTIKLLRRWNSTP